MSSGEHEQEDEEEDAEQQHDGEGGREDPELHAAAPERLAAPPRLLRGGTGAAGLGVPVWILHTTRPRPSQHSNRVENQYGTVTTTLATCHTSASAVGLHPHQFWVIGSDHIEQFRKLRPNFWVAGQEMLQSDPILTHTQACSAGNSGGAECLF